jgi:hypothetical protein
MCPSLKKQGRDEIVFVNIEIMYTSLDYEMCQYHPFLPTSHLYNIQDAVRKSLTGMLAMWCQGFKTDYHSGEAAQTGGASNERSVIAVVAK